jgi:ATP-binding cassette, subfamily B, multidrug efflux pump
MRHTGLRFLLPYMRPYRRHLIVGALYALFGATASAFGPTLLGMAIDEIQRGIRLDVLALYALGLIGLAATMALFRYLLRMLTGDIAAGVSYQMSKDLFDRLLLFDRETMQQYGTGELLSRASNDFIYIWRFYSAGFQMSMHALLLLLIGTSLMALTSLPMAGLVVGLLAVSLAIQVYFGRVLEQSFDKVQAEMAHISSYAQEAPTVAAFRRANDAYARRTLDFVLRNSAISPLPSLVVKLAATLVVGVGGALIVQGQLTLGQYVQFIVYLGLLAGAAQSLSQAFERLQQGSAAAGRIGEVLRRRPRIADAPDAISPSIRGTIRLENVGVRAGGEHRWALRNVTLDIPAGTTLGIVGATGAGKSTLLSLLGRVRDPDEGRVLIDGVDIRMMKQETLRQAVAYVPQETLLFSMPLRENITLGLERVPDERIHEAARQARLTNDLAQLPRGLATIVGGQKQRTAIARALVRDPQVLMLDDALASVDAHTAAEIIGELSGARAGRTCLVVSQRLASVRDADQIIVLEQGSVVEQGTHQSLLALNGRYAAMYRRELRQAEEDSTADSQPVPASEEE